MFQNPLTVGIDIGHHSIKAVVLSQKKSQLALVAFAEVVPTTPIINDQHTVDVGGLLSAIRQIRKSLPRRARRTILALPDSAVISKVIQLDTNLTDEEAEFAVTQALSASSPFPVDELRLDFYPAVSPGPSELSATAPYQVFAARKATLDPRVECLKKAGLRPDVMELQTHALLWLATFTAEQSGLSGQWGVVDIGHRLTEFAVHPAGSGAYHREIAWGAGQLTPTRAAGEPVLTMPDSEQSEAFTKQLADQLRRQFQLYNSTHATAPLEGVWLCGGGQHVVSESLLARLLGLEVRWLNPFRCLPSDKKLGEIAGEHLYSQYAVATGLALRGVAP
ncbi:type IV pilus assembly protein PilM [Photobacterium sp. MCCC 1A19761]|uniref:type IV pilus biogenesis protein PilM n=1 Tax=Photobacterium sp. MCCC 1A19761 TaxID=3115000 RepID=UPI00307D130D